MLAHMLTATAPQSRSAAARSRSRSPARFCRFARWRDARRRCPSLAAHARSTALTRIQLCSPVLVSPKRPCSFSPCRTNDRCVGLLTRDLDLALVPDDHRAGAPRRLLVHPLELRRVKRMVRRPEPPGAWRRDQARAPSAPPTNAARRRSRGADRNAAWWRREAGRRNGTRTTGSLCAEDVRISAFGPQHHAIALDSSVFNASRDRARFERLQRHAVTDLLSRRRSSRSPPGPRRFRAPGCAAHARRAEPERASP